MFFFIANPGSGKTAFVQGLAQRDNKHIYLEVDLSKMISNLNDPNEMAAILKHCLSKLQNIVMLRISLLFFLWTSSIRLSSSQTPLLRH